MVESNLKQNQTATRFISKYLHVFRGYDQFFSRNIIYPNPQSLLQFISILLHSIISCKSTDALKLCALSRVLICSLTLCSPWRIIDWVICFPFTSQTADKVQREFWLSKDAFFVSICFDFSVLLRSSSEAPISTWSWRGKDAAFNATLASSSYL